MLEDRLPERYRVRARVRAVAQYIEPEAWLDVGTGDGAFPGAAREELRYTAFDGTGTGAELERARRTGRVDEAYEGSLPELAGRLAGRYDAVSMLRCPERRPERGVAEVRGELEAAREVLRGGGLLLLESAGPPPGGLRGAGFVVLRVERGVRWGGVYRTLARRG
ncbi:hypothetical protein GTW43_21075 [Streptomyces sp. SID5785]|uniref:hypothetical protein n=1 Tax=Streptomyces sp. SID5785 TaxID=2690309 RepID=UPI0013612965|nr:hypothetical protein [Streptomyces sp. SID5785]MZD07556.1 hypothetical protein [Streptomyces sp. SID5785]